MKSTDPYVSKINLLYYPSNFSTSSNVISSLPYEYDEVILFIIDGLREDLVTLSLDHLDECVQEDEEEIEKCYRLKLKNIYEKNSNFTSFESTSFSIQEYEKREKNKKNKKINLPYNKFSFLHYLLLEYPSQSLLYKLSTPPPTVTLPRLKAIMTGSPPPLTDMYNNLSVDEDEIGETVKKTNGFCYNEDNLIDQFINKYIKNNSSSSLNIYGDNTWYKLFPTCLSSSSFSHSLDTHDTDSADLLILKQYFTKILSQKKGKVEKKEEIEEMVRSNNEKDLTILHFLGIDHLAHTFSLSHPSISNRILRYNFLLELLVDYIQGNNSNLNFDFLNFEEDLNESYELKEIFDNLKINVKNEEKNKANNDENKKKTLLLVLGDHGLTNEGEHGGSSPSETSSVLFIFSNIPFLPLHQSTKSSNYFLNRKLNFQENNQEKNATEDKNSLYPLYSVINILKTPLEVSQYDLLPTLSRVLHLPLPFNNIGKIIPELFFSPSNSNELFSISFSKSFLQLEEINKNSIQIWKFLLSSFYQKNSSQIFIDLENIYERIKKFYIENEIDSNHSLIIYQFLYKELKVLSQNLDRNYSKKLGNIYQELLLALMDHSELLFNYLNSEEIESKEEEIKLKKTFHHYNNFFNEVNTFIR